MLRIGLSRNIDKPHLLAVQPFETGGLGGTR